MRNDNTTQLIEYNQNNLLMIHTLCARIDILMIDILELDVTKYSKTIYIIVYDIFTQTYIN